MVSVEWNDYRLGYWNLNESAVENKISRTEATEIWTPKLILANNPDGIQVMYDPTVYNNNILLIRNGSSQKAPLTQLEEARLYSPYDTRIWMKIFHNLKFDCHFELNQFPFDSQKCFVEVSMVFFSYLGDIYSILSPIAAT